MTQTQRQITAGLLFGLLGFCANWCRLELFFGVDFLFGSIFVMLALLLYGEIAGVIAGIMAACCTWLIWYHPWAVIIFTGEVLFIAWWLRTRSRDIIVPAVIYWLFLGGPLVWCFYSSVMGMPVQPTILVMLKQAINGVMNTLMATVVVQIIRLRSHRSDELLSLRQLVATMVMTFVLIPALTYLGIQTWSRLQEEEAELITGMVNTAGQTQYAVRNWLDNHYRSVITLAEVAGDPASTSPALLQQRADAIKAGSHDFLRLGILNRNAVSVVVSPSGKGTGIYRSIDLSDRPYIWLLRETKKPAVSDLVVGRLGSPAVILPMVAPIIIDGDLKGFTLGALDPTVLRPTLLILTRSEIQKVTLVDRSHRVIVSSDPKLKLQAPYQRPSGWTSRTLARDVSQWTPRPDQASSPMQRWRSSRYVRELPVGSTVPWTVIVESSPAAMLALLSTQSINSFILMFVLIILTVGFSRMACGRLVLPLLQLQSVGIDLPRQLAQESGEIVWPESDIIEIRGLIGNFREMAAGMTRYVRELRQLNETLEERVTQRTTSLEEKSAFLTALLASLPDLVFFKDRTSSYLGSNVNQAQEFGRTQEEMVGATDFDFFVPEVAQKLRKNDQEVLETGMIRTFLEPLRLLDGRSFQSETVKAPLVLTTGEIIGLVGITRDITRRLRHEQGLVQARIAAEAANRAKSMFLATMSHELRTPLNAILGLSEMLQEGIMGGVTPEQRRSLATIEESGRHLLAVITDILDLTQIESDRLELEIASVQVEELCHACLHSVREQALKKRIALSLSLRQAPEKMLTDPRRLKQILGNLMGNAVKFTPEGGNIGLEICGDDAARRVGFTVWDTGIGIDPDNLKKLFSPFVQVDSRLSRLYEGSGLGLTLAARLTELLGGEVAVESEPGKGSRFTVTFPCGEPDAPQIPQQCSESSSVCPPPPGAGGS
jgi:PAS domain S-box-containing protein